MATIGRVAVYAVLALIRVTPVGAQLATPEAAIRAQVQGFYRDDRDNRWPDVLDHFWVGKITARWTAPTSTHAWLAAGPLDRDSACVAGKDHVLAMSIALIDDRWARVFVTRCGGGPPDELWMLRVGEDWKSARLTPGYFTAACCRSAPPPRRGGPRGPPDPGTPGTPLRAPAPPHRSHPTAVLRRGRGHGAPRAGPTRCPPPRRTHRSGPPAVRRPRGTDRGRALRALPGRGSRSVPRRGRRAGRGWAWRSPSARWCRSPTGRLPSSGRPAARVLPGVDAPVTPGGRRLRHARAGSAPPARASARGRSRGTARGRTGHRSCRYDGGCATPRARCRRSRALRATRARAGTRCPRACRRDRTGRRGRRAWCGNVIAWDDVGAQHAAPLRLCVTPSCYVVARRRLYFQQHIMRPRLPRREVLEVHVELGVDDHPARPHVYEPHPVGDFPVQVREQRITHVHPLVY